MDNIIYHEVELLKASIKGDTNAFEIIIKKYQSYVCAITFSATGNVGESEVLAQEVFVNAWLGLAKLKNPSKFKSWLKSITKNVIRGWLRNRKRDIISNAASEELLEGEGTNEFEPAQMAIKAEQQSIVREALDQIPPKYREPLVLYYRNKESIKQVAQQLELSEEVVRSRLFRGRKYLREQVAAMIETTISETGPDKTFTIMVIGSITALSLKSGTASAANIASAAASGTGKVVSFTTLISGTSGKLLAAAAAIVIVISLLLLNIHKSNPVNEPNSPENINISQSYQAQPLEDTNNAGTLVSELPASEFSSITDTNQVELGNDDTEIQNSLLTQTSEYTFQPKGLVSGLITDIETGEPVVNAELSLYVEPMKKIFNTRSDEHGFYFFDNIENPGKSRMSIKSFEYVGYLDIYNSAPVIPLKEGEKFVKHFKLPRACQIDLFVSDANGVPIKGADASVTIVSESSCPNQSYTISKTDDNGYMHIGGIAPSEEKYLLTVMHLSLFDHIRVDGKIQQISKIDYAPTGEYIELNNPDKIERVEVILEKGLEIKGYIEFADGIPGYDLEVSAYPPWWNVELAANQFAVDELGFFTLKNIIPGQYSISISTNGKNASQQIYKMTKIVLPLSDKDLFTINLPIKSSERLFSLDGSIIYKGPTESEMVHLEARLSEESIDAVKTVTIYSNVESNPFKIDDLEAGTYSLRVSGTNMYKLIKNIQVPGDFVEFELSLAPKPKIDILVLDAKTNQPVTGYKFRAKKIKQLTHLQRLQEDQWFDVNDENGKSEIELVGPGIYQIQVVADNYAAQWSEEINTDEILNTTIKLKPGGTIKGTIVDKQGNPINGAKVIPFSKSQGTYSETENLFVSEEGTTQSIDGKFILKDLSPGLETIKVTHPDYAYKIIKDIQVNAGQTTDSIEITMDQGTTIEGYVYDNDGNPEPGLVLILKRKDLPYQSVLNMSQFGTIITDSNGFFSVSGVSGDQCIISRKDEIEGLGLIWRSVDFHGNDIVQLEFGGNPLLSGTLIIDGKPLANQRIVISPAQPELYREFYSATKTDSKGNFVFRSLIPGKYWISYKLDQNWLILTEVDVQKENEDTDIGVITYETRKE